VLERIRDQLVEHDRHRAGAACRQRGAAVHVASHAIAGAEHIERAVRHCARERGQLDLTRMRQQRILERRHTAQARDRDVERLGQLARRSAMPLEDEQRLNRREIVAHAMLQLAQQQRGGLGVASRALVESAIFRGELGERSAQSRHLALGVPNADQLFHAIRDLGRRRRCTEPDVGRCSVRPLARPRRERHDRQHRHLKAGLETPRDREHN